MNQDLDLVEAVRAAGCDPTDEARASIRSTLVGELAGKSSIRLGRTSTPTRRRWPVLVAIGLAAAAVAVTVVVVRTGDDTARIVPAETTVPPPPSPSSAGSTSTTFTTVEARPAVALDDLVGYRWVLVDGDAEWETSVPYVEFGVEGELLSGNDGCNWFDGAGTLEGDRLQLEAVAATSMGCVLDITTVLPGDGDRVELSADRTELTFDGEQQLVYVRLDTIPAATTATMTGRWAPANGSLPALELRADGGGGFGACGLSWSVTSTFTVAGWPEDPYSCRTDALDVTSDRLVELLTGGPVDPRVPTDGDMLYLSDDQFVLRLGVSAPTDLLAGWPVPPVEPADLELVPLLLPTSPVPADRVIRIEGAGDEPVVLHDYVQTWVGGASSSELVEITTNIGQHHDPATIAEVIEVPPWDTAFLRATDPEVTTHLALDDPSGLVNIWTTGDRETATGIAGSLTARDDGRPGWDVGALDGSFTLVHEGWSAAPAERTIRWEAGGRIAAQLTIAWRSPGVLTGVALDGSVTLADVGGAPALVLASAGRVAVNWSPSSDLTVTLGLYGSPEQALAIARSLQPVDQATWDAASELETSPDGCSSMFC